MPSDSPSPRPRLIEGGYAVRYVHHLTEHAYAVYGCPWCADDKVEQDNEDGRERLAYNRSR